MSKTIIPSDKAQEKRMANPGKNNVFVSSRGGGPAEAKMTKNASVKHHNPEFFKRQTDRASNENVGRGVGAVGVRDEGPGANGIGPGRRVSTQGNENVGRGVGNTGRDAKKDNIPARKDVPIQRDFNHHQKNVGKDPGRGVGKVGVDNRARVHQMDTMPSMGASNPVRKSASPPQTKQMGGRKTDQNQMQLKQFTRGTMY